MAYARAGLSGYVQDLDGAARVDHRVKNQGHLAMQAEANVYRALLVAKIIGTMISLAVFNR
jgi:hypothetical protein